jgi:N6-L-threonylcarbamoyladenine synthase
MVKPKTILLAGGVAANRRLRERMRSVLSAQYSALRYLEPNLQFTTDNAAMIAAAGYYLARKKRFADWRTLEPDSNWEIGI